MHIQFRVFPDYGTFIQRVPIDKKDHYIIKEIFITSNGGFWFSTNKKKQNLTINMNIPFVHLNDCKNIEYNKLQFDHPPYKVTRDNLKYDPKKKQLIIGDSIWPWKSPVWVKSILGCYTGSEIPKKKMKIKGDWILDRHGKIIYFILNYVPIIRSNGKIENEPASQEQLDYAKKLEETLKTLE